MTIAEHTAGFPECHCHLAHTRLANGDRPDAGHDFALRKMAVADDPPETDARLRTIMNELPSMTSSETASLQCGEIMMRHLEEPFDAEAGY